MDGATGETGLCVQLLAEEGPGKLPEPAPTQSPLMLELNVTEKQLCLRLIVTTTPVQVKRGAGKLIVIIQPSSYIITNTPILTVH